MAVMTSIKVGVTHALDTPNGTAIVLGRASLGWSFLRSVGVSRGSQQKYTAPVSSSTIGVASHHNPLRMSDTYTPYASASFAMTSIVVDALVDASFSVAVIRDASNVSERLVARSVANAVRDIVSAFTPTTSDAMVSRSTTDGRFRFERRCVRRGVKRSGKAPAESRSLIRVRTFTNRLRVRRLSLLELGELFL
jgi:hypothetical protein